MHTVENQLDSYTLTLADPLATLEVAGGKGSSLARMAGAELPVPPGFHVTTAAYRRFVAADGLHERILEVAAGVAADDPGTWTTAANAIATLIAAQPVPEDVAQEIRTGYARLGEVAVAVRSSATAEDLPEMSFAGQQDSYLNIVGAEAVVAAVKRCWASLWTDRALGYRARHGISADDVALAVVVQELVPADSAGVAFTANPLTGARDEVLINAAWGLGEAIVSGRVTPDTIVIAKSGNTIRQRDISDKESMTVRTADGTREEAVPEDRRRLPVLEPAAEAELARLAVRIEEFYGQPMDIEWARHAQRFFVVQARPITALPDAAPAATEQDWDLPDPHGKYIRSSVMELLPDPLSPLFATLGIPAWERATLAHYRAIQLPYFSEPLAVINGYGYYNVDYRGGLLVRMALAQPKFLSRTLPRLLRSAPERWRTARDRYRQVAGQWEGVDLTAEPAVRLLGGMAEIVDEAARYYLTIQGSALPAAYLSESLFTKAYNVVKASDDPPAATFLLGFDSKPIRGEQALYDLARWARTQPGLTELLTTATVADLTADRDNAAWPEFRQRFQRHLTEFGDMVYDLDFAKPLPADDPASQLQVLRFFLGEDAPDPYARQRTAVRARTEAERCLENKRPRFVRRLPLRLLGWAQSAAPLREDALADVGAGWPAVRRLAAELGRRLVDSGVLEAPADVYWLRLPELQAATRALDAGRTPDDSRATVAERHALWQAQRARTAPHVLPVKGGGKILGIDFGKETSPDEVAIKGTPGSPGRATGPARIVHGPAEFDQMRPGDVLVAKMTTPAWTPLFALASAIVTDVGGALSHSSIVAREYHIPAVLGTGNATERLRTGQQITVDGNAGTVGVDEH
ncbi:PEP/pyruvate-binding domain-containing protein [Nocardia goodfellowii]|uniref:Phosphoenolpyruvate synthase n=1 Tax=Nocardia goodfellowii TaxID=882446 RepID=A0ABS4QHZ2_9NOCA|nr:PEP/pyruvate-binding domain-containing protein [Nocardia goodfellowii]MBP2191327.1 pyruvate,water dikinase [Nocardia goodfellowii]